MADVLHAPAMTRDQFLDWVQRQETRFEFDGEEPVAMQGASINHAQIVANLQAALRARLRGAGWRVLATDVGVATEGSRVRYPDVVVARGPVDGRSLLVPGVVAVFEVISPGNERTDRVVKVREYLAVPSIELYAIVEQDFVGVTLLERHEDHWRATPFGIGDEVALRVLGVTLSMAEVYEDTGLLDEVAPTGD